MTDLSRLTKAEIIELYEESEAKRKELDEMIIKNKAQIEEDMGFSRTPEELKTHLEKQNEKDSIKRMTRGRWVSKEKYQEFLKDQKLGGVRQ